MVGFGITGVSVLGYTTRVYLISFSLNEIITRPLRPYIILPWIFIAKSTVNSPVLWFSVLINLRHTIMGFVVKHWKRSPSLICVGVIRRIPQSVKLYLLKRMAFLSFFLSFFLSLQKLSLETSQYIRNVYIPTNWWHSKWKSSCNYITTQWYSASFQSCRLCSE